MMGRLISFIFVLCFAATSLAAEYSHYASLLQANWPIPSSDSNDCSSHNPYRWIDKAQEMISVEPLQRKVALNNDEVMVLRNLLISQAYNRLFTYSLQVQKTENPEIKFIWIAAGSQASVTVGHALQVGLADKYPIGSRQRAIFRRLESLYPHLPGTQSFILKKVSKVKQKTAENNWRVYSDIFWQHLAYMTCGLDEVVLLNKALIAEKIRQGRLSDVDHYEKFISVWNEMDQGHYLEANMQLIYIEQHNILQKYMYDGLDAKAANALMLFNGMAKADLSGPEGRRIQPFTEYALDHKLYPNLSSFPVRFEWMKYVVSEQAAYLEQLATIPNVESALERSLRESYQVVNDYLNL